jgi:hypothetical protein
MLKSLLIFVAAFLAVSDAACCDRVMVDSTGSLPNSSQFWVIGTYDRVSDGPEGRSNYIQEESQKTLHYMPEFRVNRFMNNCMLDIILSIYCIFRIGTLAITPALKMPTPGVLTTPSALRTSAPGGSTTLVETGFRTDL